MTWAALDRGHHSALVTESAHMLVVLCYVYKPAKADTFFSSQVGNIFVSPRAAHGPLAVRYVGPWVFAKRPTNGITQRLRHTGTGGQGWEGPQLLACRAIRTTTAIP